LKHVEGISEQKGVQLWWLYMCWCILSEFMLRQHHTYSNIRWGCSVTQHVIFENAWNWILQNNKNSQLIQTSHDFILSQCCCWVCKSSCVIGHVLSTNHQWLVTQWYTLTHYSLSSTSFKPSLTSHPKVYPHSPAACHVLPSNHQWLVTQWYTLTHYSLSSTSFKPSLTSHPKVYPHSPAACHVLPSNHHWLGTQWCILTPYSLSCKVKIKESSNRPGVAQRVPGGLGSQISWHSAREGGEVVSLTHRLPLPPGMYLVLIFTRGWVDPRATVWSEENMSLKNPVTPPGINPGTVQLVAQRLNYYATPGPHSLSFKPSVTSHPMV